MIKSKFKAVVILAIACLFLGSLAVARVVKSRSLPTAQVESAQPQGTPSQECKTEKQKEHSKLYQSYGRGKKLREMKGEGEVGYRVGLPLPTITPGPSPTYYQVINKFVCDADAVVIAEVKNKTSLLTDAEDFIFTDYELSVSEVLKDNSRAHIETSAVITATRPGGTVQLNDGRTATIRFDSVPPFRVGGKYLLFLQFIPTTGAYKAFTSEGSYELRGKKFSKVTQESLRKELDEEIEPTAFINDIRAAAISGCSNNQEGEKR